MLDKFDLENVVESIDNLTKAVNNLNEDLNIRLSSKEGIDVSDNLEQISNDINDYIKWKQGVQV